MNCVCVLCEMSSSLTVTVDFLNSQKVMHFITVQVSGKLRIISICIHMCVFICMFSYVCQYVCVCVCLCLFLFVLICMCVSVSIYVHLCE